MVALLVTGAACSGNDEPAPPTTTAPPPSPGLTPETPDLEQPLLPGDMAVDALCNALALAVADGDDAARNSLARALAAAVRESEAGTEEQREMVAEVLDASPQAAGLSLAAGVLVEGLGMVGCQELSEEVLAPPQVDAEIVSLQIEMARERWEESGLGDADYTIVMFVERSSWFDAGSDTSGEECGLFGEWLVLVSPGEVIDSPGEVVGARDRFSGCPIDLSDELFSPIPTTVEEMFDFVDANVEMIDEVIFDRTDGWPVAVSLALGDGFVFFRVQGVTPGHPEGPEEVLAEVEEQRALWEAAGIDTYTLTARRLCFCPAELTLWYTVEVEDGEVVAVSRADPLGTDDAAELADFLPRTVEDLFDEVADAAYADSLVVIYHDSLGYPVSIDVDPLINAVDEEYQIEGVVLPG